MKKVSICALSLLLLGATTPTQAEEEPNLIEHLRAFASNAKYIPQVPLAAQSAPAACIFIGGYADELGGYFNRVGTNLPVLPQWGEVPRAYYHWHYSKQAEYQKAPARIAKDIDAFRKMNPKAPIALMGHSLGAAAAVQVANLLSPDYGKIYLVTVDPVDRVASRQRPKQVTWWGNAYVLHSQSNRDFAHQMGGRWGKVKGADVNLLFDGRLRDERGYPFIHDNAWSLITSRSTHPRSLFEELLLVIPQVVKPATPPPSPEKKKEEKEATQS